MAEILTEIYEPKFYDFSYGFRENRDCPAALKTLRETLAIRTNWVVDVDIKGFFDNVSHEWLMKFLEHDIEDKNFLRYVTRFLKAGIMEEGKYIDTDKGVPQGGSISPILANVYLHYVLDIWFAKKAVKNNKGEASMIRYADDGAPAFNMRAKRGTFMKR